MVYTLYHPSLVKLETVEYWLHHGLPHHLNFWSSNVVSLDVVCCWISTIAFALADCEPPSHQHPVVVWSIISSWGPLTYHWLYLLDIRITRKCMFQVSEQVWLGQLGLYEIHCFLVPSFSGRPFRRPAIAGSPWLHDGPVNSVNPRELSLVWSWTSLI